MRTNGLSNRKFINSYVKFWRKRHNRRTTKRRGRGGRGGRPPLPFFENRKKCPDFGKKGPNCVHPWVESSIQNVVLGVSRRKSSKIFPCRAFFCVFLTKSLSKCPNSTKPPLPEKFLVARLYSVVVLA